MINIKPKTQPGVLSLGVIGLRDLISSIDLLPVKKLFCKFDISGDSKEPIVTNKHPVKGGASNFLEVLALEIDVPLNLDYAPVLTVYCYDTLMGAFGKRLVGVANIPLESYCEKIINSLHDITNVFQQSQETQRSEGVEMNDIMLKMKSKKKQNLSIQQKQGDDQEEIKQEEENEDKLANVIKQRELIQEVANKAKSNNLQSDTLH